MGLPWGQLITLMLSVPATVSTENSDLIIRISLKNCGAISKSIELKLGIYCVWTHLNSLFHAESKLGNKSLNLYIFHNITRWDLRSEY